MADLPRSQRVLVACLLCGAASFVAACAGAATPLRADDGRDGAPYGDYLAARWASLAQSPTDAARFYRRALARDPGNPMLVEEAFHASLLAAEWSDAVRLAGATLEIDPANGEARFALAADAMARGQHRRAAETLDGATFGPIDNLAASITLAWARAGQGDTESALAALAEGRSEPALFSALMSLHEGMLLDRDGNPGAEAVLRAAVDAYALPAFATREYGRYLERAGKMDQARAVYERRLTDAPTDRVVAAELARLEAGGEPERATPAEAAALAFYAGAATLLGRDFSDRGQTYLVLSLRMDDDFAPSAILLGQMMTAQERFDEAEALLASIADDPVMGVEARIRLAELAAARDDIAAAEAMLRALLDEGGGEVAARALVESLRMTEQWAEAETLLDRLIAERAEAGEADDYRLLFSRAVVRERQGKWAEAEADFRAAMALDPEDALLLNYLGYAMVDRGENLEEGLDLIRRAVALQPRAGFIIDSLGWAHYRLGDYEEAVQYLERAAGLEPGAADINDHLGDAYWRVGRRLEARFQWERALTLDEDGTLREAVERKLAEGLPPENGPPPMAAKQ